MKGMIIKMPTALLLLFLNFVGRFIYVCAEICYWRSSLTIDKVQSDTNLKALAVSNISLFLIKIIIQLCDRQ